MCIDKKLKIRRKQNMKNFNLNDSRVYVSTYKKYNEGSLRRFIYRWLLF